MTPTLTGPILLLAYLPQIAALLVYLIVIVYARGALAGIARGLFLLISLLIFKRVDEIFGIYDDVATLVMSYAVVIVLGYDLINVVRVSRENDRLRIEQARLQAEIDAQKRNAEEQLHKAAAARIAELEQLRQRDEQNSGPWSTMSEPRQAFVTMRAPRESEREVLAL